MWPELKKIRLSMWVWLCRNPLLFSDGLFCSHYMYSRYFTEAQNTIFWFLCLTHWGRDKVVSIFQMTISIAFSLMKMFEFRLEFHWSLFPRFHLNKPELFQIMAWHWWGAKPLSEPMMVRLQTHICVTQPQWVNKQNVKENINLFRTELI